VTYLAVQMSLYLASAALIGICLGWLFWGRSYHRHIAKIHSEMTASLEAERSLSDETKRELQDAEARLNQSVEAEKANSAKAMTEIQKLLESEKEAARTARVENENLRLEMETAVNAEKTSASSAIQGAMQDAEQLKATVEEGKTRETQIRAELEELRLMAGAEKLAAESARTEIEQLRTEMKTSLDVERETSRAAKRALDDIQTTLSRTFGEGAGFVAALDAQSENSLAGKAAAISGNMKNDSQEIDNDNQTKSIDDLDEEKKPVNVSDSENPSSIDIEPGTAFDVPNHKTAAFDGPEQANEPVVVPVVPIDTNLHPVADSTASLNGEDQQSPDLTESAMGEPEQLDPPVAIDAQPGEQEKRVRPSSFYKQRPDEVDSLKEIDGIDSSIEELLNEQGCYQFKQLAHFSSDDIDWLSQALSDVPDLKERIERDGWVEQARELQIKKYVTTNADRPRWWSRRRLQ